MAFHTFGSELAFDEAARRGIPGMTGRVTDYETGIPVETYDMDGNPKPVVTNMDGYVGYFRTPDTVNQVELRFGHVTLHQTAKELIQGAAEAVAELERLTVSHIDLDTDGTPYYSPGSVTVSVKQDTDGVPYYIPA